MVEPLLRDHEAMVVLADLDEDADKEVVADLGGNGVSCNVASGGRYM